MAKTGLKTSYSTNSDPVLDTFTQKVVASLLGNANFQNTSPTAGELEQIQVAFNAAIERASSGDRVAIALKNQFRKEVLSSLKQLANDIENQANGDVAKLLSSGFELIGAGDSAPAMEAPKEFMIADGADKGQLKFSCQRVPQAVSYIFEYTEGVPTADSRWSQVTSTVCKCVVTGLKSDVRIFARVTAVGRKGQKITSAVDSRIVQ